MSYLNSNLQMFWWLHLLQVYQNFLGNLCIKCKQNETLMAPRIMIDDFIGFKCRSLIEGCAVVATPNHLIIFNYVPPEELMETPIRDPYLIFFSVTTHFDCNFLRRYLTKIWKRCWLSNDVLQTNQMQCEIVNKTARGWLRMQSTNWQIKNTQKLIK